MAGVTHLQHCRMLLGSHQLLLMQVAFGDSFRVGFKHPTLCKERL